MRLSPAALLVLVPLIAPALLPPVAVAAKRVQRARMLMGTLCTAVAQGPDTAAAGAALDESLDQIARLEGLLSPWQPESELSKLNTTGAERRIECSPDLFAVLDSSLALAAETDGAFDPTVEPLMRAWDLRGQGRVPEPGELAELRLRVGWRLVQAFRPLRTVRFQRDSMGLDFGGIAKGYALDRAADVLRRHGLKRAVLNLGGEMVAFSDKAAWRVTVADPDQRLRPVVRLDVRRAAVSTSGQGERFFEIGGRRYGHVLDPVSGAPIETGATVTVVTRSGTRADGLSTALLVMGRAKAEAFVSDRRDIGALWLERKDGVLEGWRWNLPGATASPGVKIEWMN